MGEYLPEIASDVASAFAKSISHAVGDGIIEDVFGKGLITQNGSPARIWDILHTNLAKAFKHSHIVAKPSKRGAWEILPVFDKEINVLFCCMREKNFAAIAKRDPKKRKYHYLNALLQSFNRDLPCGQIKLSIVREAHEDMGDVIASIISRITADLEIPQGLIRRHALVLFHSYDSQLISLRCCAINSQFEIISSLDWSAFIPATASIIAETVEDVTNISNTPAQGLKLKKKAEDRLDKKSNISLYQDNQENEKND